MPAGRPSKYNDGIPDEMLAFFDMKETYEKVVIKETHKRSDKGAVTSIVEYKLIPKPLPTFERFAHNIGVDYRTLYEWSTAIVDPDAPEPELKYPEFSHAYNQCKYLQKDFLIQNGLAGMSPPAAFIFTAKNITDMTDKQIIETKDADYKEKRDALGQFFDTLRHDAGNSTGTVESSSPTS